ncbi:MAG: hypothetical protein GY948_13835 [Alphaproteobacteria bacterium]|nr:hypothetical protein [Alphaproteobacteria bacterium]
MIGGGAVIHELDIPAAPPIASLNGIGGESFVGGVMAGINHRLWPRVVVGAQFDALFNTDQVKLTDRASLPTSPLMPVSPCRPGLGIC